jgi:hypothetical protein
MASRSDLGDVTPNNLGQVRVLHKVLFPVNYGDNFYNELLEADEFAKLGTNKGIYKYSTMTYHIYY